MTIFLLCIGCQKGGTTWLSEHLRGFPEVRLGARKEMHVLDVHFLPGNRGWHDTRIAVREDVLRRMRASGTDAKAIGRVEAEIAAYREALALAPDLDAYAAYFRARADADPGVRVVADLTPDYALLGAQDWAQVRAALVRRGFAPRVLFLMRDPVGRLESVWRMEARDAATKAQRGRSLPRRLAKRVQARLRDMAARFGLGGGDARFEAFARTAPNLDRSRFEATIAAVEAAFPPEEIRYEFYEALFTPEVVAGIMGFLDLPNRPAAYDERVNASPLQVPLAPQERAKVRALLDPTYRFCAERFGADRIRALWKNA